MLDEKKRRAEKSDVEQMMGGKGSRGKGRGGKGRKVKDCGACVEHSALEKRFCHFRMPPLFSLWLPRVGMWWESLLCLGRFLTE